MFEFSVNDLYYGFLIKCEAKRMHVDLVAVYDYIRDYSGKIIFLIGVVLLIVGVLALNLYGSILSAGSLFFGILFTVFGLFVQLGFFSGNLRSLGGVGTILICVSIIFLAFSVVMFEFLEVSSAGIVPWIYHGYVRGYIVIMSSERPYLWLSALFMQSGLALFITGIVLKIFHAVKP